MTHHPSPDSDTLSVRGPADLIGAVPYLLGFAPEQSLVLVAMKDTALIVTVRIDLADCDSDALEQSMAAIKRFNRKLRA